MSRLKADFILLFVAVIWGTAFIAQKTAHDHVGPYTFIAARFLLSALVVLPLMLRERKIAYPQAPRMDIFLLLLGFCAGVICQQVGMVAASVTHAGFLTGLYVVFAPLICFFIYRQKLAGTVMPAALLSALGVWLLSGGIEFDAFGFGDFLVLLGALGFALQVVLVGRILHRKTAAPYFICFLQYAVVTLIAGTLALMIEKPTLDGLRAVAGEIFYAGAISGGIAYTLQVVAQQHAPPAEAAVILGSEALFAAIAGALLLGDRLSPLGYAGCGFILLAVLFVELGPFLRKSLFSRFFRPRTLGL